MMLGEDIDVNIIDPGESLSRICMKWRMKRHAGYREEKVSNGNGRNGNGDSAHGNTASGNNSSNQENQASTNACLATVTPVQKPGKRLNTKHRLEDENSQQELNLETARQICVDGKMYELVDLTKEEVHKSNIGTNVLHLSPTKFTETRARPYTLPCRHERAASHRSRTASIRCAWQYGNI